jgi:hypothetical protein
MLIPLAIGIAVGNDASKRGMNAWGWGIFVFLILIIGLPAYFITRKPKLSEQSFDNTDILDDQNLSS